MGWQLQSTGDFVYGLSFAVIFGLFIAAVWVLYLVGDLPGRIASARGHPQASAIGVCGWLGLLVFVLWPVALVWAYVTPKSRQHLSSRLDAEQVDDVAEDLHELSEQIAAIKSKIASLSASKKHAN